MVNISNPTIQSPISGVLSVVVADDSDFYYTNVINSLNQYVKKYAVDRLMSLEGILNYFSVSKKIDLIILDVYFSDGKLEEELVQIKINYPESIIIVMSGQTDIRLAISMLDYGANFYIVKGESFTSDLMVALSNAVEILEVKHDYRNLLESAFASENFPATLFHLTEIGVQVVESDFDEFPESLSRSTEDYLLNLGLSLMLVVGQGHSYNEGCFNVPGGEAKSFTCLLFVFRLENPTAVDPRLKKGYYQICLFVPKYLFSMFPPIDDLNQLIDRIKENVKDSTELQDNSLPRLKQMIIDEIKNRKLKR